MCDRNLVVFQSGAPRRGPTLEIALFRRGCQSLASHFFYPSAHRLSPYCFVISFVFCRDEIIPDGSKGAGALGGKGKPQMTPPPPGFARNEYVTGPPEPTYTNSQDDPYTDYDSGPQTSYY